VVYCAERFNCSVNDLIYGRLPIIIYFNDETTLDRVAFLRELIMIRDSSLTLSGLLSSDELNDIIYHVCMSYSWLLSSFIFTLYILYFVYDLIINNNNRLA